MPVFFSALWNASTGTGGPAFPDSVAQGPEMTSVREALRMAEGLRGGRCRGLRRADSCVSCLQSPALSGDARDPHVEDCVPEETGGPRRAGRQVQAESASST